MKDQSKPNGRPPTVFTPQQVEQVEKLASMLTKSQLADLFGVSENTFRAIEERQPEVSAAYKRGKASAIIDISRNLIQQSNKGNTAATIFYLKTQAGWRETDESQVQREPITINIVKPDGAD